MIDTHFVLVGAAINVACSSAYIRETIAGRTRPNRATWALWAAAPMIAFSAELSQGVRLQALPTLMSGLMPFLIFLSSFVNRHASWRLGRFDYICAATSVLALVLWWATRSSSVAIVFAILADFLAGVPTLVKARHHPESESIVAFVGGLCSSSIGILTAATVSVAALAFPVYLAAMCTLLIALILAPRPAAHASAR